MKDMKDVDNTTRDERFATSYACSSLKQRYDAVVTDDTCGIGSFLWKFPSEGSNSSGRSSHHALVFPLASRSCNSSAVTGSVPMYPRKCAKCECAWVSDRSAERRHRRVCAGESDKSSKANKGAPVKGQDASDDGNEDSDEATRERQINGSARHASSAAVAKLGVARRVWCEVDSSLSRLQWREDITSEQDFASCVIPFTDILEISTLSELPDAFQIVTSAPRTVVFQCRPSQEVADECDDERALTPQRSQFMDAEHWCEYLDVFSQYARQQRSNQHHSPTASRGITLPLVDLKDAADASDSPPNAPSFDPDAFARVTRAIIHEDVDALDTMIASDVNKMQHMTDDSGSSLLIVALKLGAGPRIIRTLLDAGVDCNAKNHDEESALLLVAASGDDEMLLVLLQADMMDVNQPCSLGATAFHAAANAGDLKVLEMLCDAGALTSAVDANGWTALHYAAACPTGIDVMHFLCELIPELIDYQCSDGNTALHVASGYGCVENVRALLQTAANPHVANRDGHTAYHVALHSHKIPCAVAINEYMANSQDLYAAAAAATARLDNAATQTAAAELPQRSGSATTSNVAAAARGTKEDAVSAPSFVSARRPQQHHLEALASDTWVEYSTPDGLPYFYNTTTGTSSWHKPPASNSDIFGNTWDDHDSDEREDGGGGNASYDVAANDDANDGDDPMVHGSGQHLSLCLIPMVSLLASLDDPTAAAKIASKRKRAREKRRRSHLQRQSHDSLSDPSQS